MAGPLPQGPETSASLSTPRQDHSPSSTATTLPAPTVRTEHHPENNNNSSSNSNSNLLSIASAGLRTPHTPVAERSRSPRTMASGTDGPGREQPFDAEERRSAPTSSHLQTAQAALGAIMGVNNGDYRSEKSIDGPTDQQQSVGSTRNEGPQRESEEGQRRRSGSSPVTMPDAYGNGENTAGTTTTLMNTAPVASPGPIEDNNSSDERPQHRDEDILEEAGNKSFSYPVPMGTTNVNDPRRGMSLPHTGYNKGSPRSPGSSKKHRCPFCSTEFTRHHNLKSHLLTHSQEKPYVCQTCQSRFRRLHDLKRHTKLHTGERPHICPKCGRRFARGDALARHNRGTGGCAGRRSSMGGFAGGVHEDEYGENRAGGPDGEEDAMEGLVYTAEPERIDEEDERKLTLPSIRRQGSPSDHQQSSAGRHVSFQAHASNTYPPLGINRPSQPGGLFPPVSTHSGSSSSTSPISPSANFSFPHSAQHGSSPAIFAQSTMTESPKPLSPNAMSSRQLGHGPEGHQRQPSISQPGVHSPTLKPGLPSQQQPQYGRGSQGSIGSLGVPPTLNLPSPQAGPPPQLPPPPTLNIPESRFTLHTPQSQTHTRSPLISPALSPGRPDPHHGHSRSNTEISIYDKNDASGTNSSNANANIFPHSPQRQLSNPNVGLSNDRLWAHIKALEDRMSGLEAEVVRLREQLAVAQSHGGITQQSQQHGHNTTTTTTSSAPNGS
ncbi:hypothetical protein VTO42DRAFT_3780 [Malbranchea cinnamomea]